MTGSWMETVEREVNRSPGMMPLADGFRHFGKPPQNDISTAQNSLSPLTFATMNEARGI